MFMHASHAVHVHGTMACNHANTARTCLHMCSTGCQHDAGLVNRSSTTNAVQLEFYISQECLRLLSQHAASC